MKGKKLLASILAVLMVMSTISFTAMNFAVFAEIDESAVASIGDVYYSTLQEAIDAAKIGDTVVLCADIHYDDASPKAGSTTFVNIAKGKDITLDLNGYTLSGENSTTNSFEFMTIEAGAVVTIEDTSNAGTGKITYEATREIPDNWLLRAYTICNKGTLIVNGGTIENATTADKQTVCDAIDNSASWGNDGVLIVNGGTIISQSYFAIRTDVNTQNTTSNGTKTTTTELNGGTIYGFYLMDRGNDISTWAPNKIYVTIGDDVVFYPRNAGTDDQSRALSFRVNNKSTYNITISDNAEINGTITGLSARLNDNYYVSISDALEDVEDGENTIQLLPGTINEIVMIKQSEGKNITIKGGEGVVFTGTFHINGDARMNGTETLTFDSINFDGSNATESFDFIKSEQKYDDRYSYPHNVYITNCNFVGSTNEGVEVVAVRHRQSSNINISNCTVINCHSLMWATGNYSTATIDNVTVINCRSGVSLGTNPNYTITNSIFDVEEYAIRMDINSDRPANCVIENCVINAAEPFVIRNNASNHPQSVKIKDNVVTLKGDGYHVKRAVAEGTNISNANLSVDLKLNYWGGAAPKCYGLDDINANSYPYYSDEAKTKIAFGPANATESEIVKAIDSSTIIADYVDEIVEIIKNLSTESQKELSAEKIEEIISAKQGAPVEEPTEEKTATVATMDSNISATVTPVVEGTGNIILDFAGNEVYSITVNEGTNTDVDKTSTPVLIKIKATKLIEKVLHDHNGVIKEIPFTQDPVTLVVTFVMNEFSNIALVPAVVTPSGSAKLSFVPSAVQEDGKAIYDIVLIGDDFETVKNFVAGEFVTILTGTGTKPFEYVIEPINDQINVYYDEVADGRKYHVNLKEFIEGVSYTSIEDPNYPNGVVIAKMTVEGYGNGVITASDILMQKHDASDENRAVAIPTIMGENAIFNIAVPTKTLTVNVEFNNIINNNPHAYQDMKVVLSGGDLADEIEFRLGNDTPGVTWNTKTYSFSIDLTINTTYSVTVSGAGYRTARYNVTLEDDKVLNFWNNVKDNAVNVEEGNNASARKVTFLAGDIVKDNQINLYDLSAVVSYFGMIDLNSDPSMYKYVKYDLNRDGKIDSKDVAYANLFAYADIKR